MLDAAHLVRLHDQATLFWHDSTAINPAAVSAFEKLVLDQHRANFDLWHREDAARDPMSGDQAIAACKRTIDKLNQRRNDLAERLDLTLLDAAPGQSEEAPLHSETPGLMIDRLSILALKSSIRTKRPTAPPPLSSTTTAIMTASSSWKSSVPTSRNVSPVFGQKFSPANDDSSSIAS